MVRIYLMGTQRIARAISRQVLLSVAGVLAVSLFLGGCRLYRRDSREVTILSWNVENLFDAVDHGNEYPEFTSEGGWTDRAYQARLRRVAEAIREMTPAPDILLLQEIENRGVLDDLMDQHLVDMRVPYRTFVRGARGSIGIAVASRYPITEVRTLTPLTSESSRMRPVLEVHFDIAGEPLVLFGNHWKSKLGGAAATEPTRRAAARLLAMRLRQLWQEDPHGAIVIAGDFNSTPGEFFTAGGAYPTALFPATVLQEIHDGHREYWWATETWLTGDQAVVWAATGDDARQYSESLDHPVFINLWDDHDVPGSFNFFGRWEQIDSFFLSPVFLNGASPELCSFLVFCPADGCDSEGRPRSWQDHPRGVSDHLPLMMTFSITGSCSPDARILELSGGSVRPSLVSRR